jgi:molybdopterin-guanine dinucleotide biosynthesis protein A
MGPLGGIAAALSDNQAEWNLITACDMPGVTRLWLGQLLQDAAEDVTIPVTSDNRLHPLCAVWRSTAAPAVQDALGAGIRAVTDVVRRLRCRTIVVEDEALVANINTPADFARFAEGQE